MSVKSEAYAKATVVYPDAGVNSILCRAAYTKGYLDGIADAANAPDSFFTLLAEELRKLWPAGEKDDKYPWRDSVENLVKRLQLVWKDRKFTDKYTVDQCLVVARRYLSRFEDDAKYMQTLPYFIYKQSIITSGDGKGKRIYKSKFADMLESTSADIEDWDSAFESDSMDQGDLI